MKHSIISIANFQYDAIFFYFEQKYEQVYNVSGFAWIALNCAYIYSIKSS